MTEEHGEVKALERPQDELRVGPIVITGIVGSIVLFAMIVGLSALFSGEQSRQLADKQAAGSAPEVRLLQSEQLSNLAEYRRVPGSEVVRLKIERAMELVLKELGDRGEQEKR